MTSENGQRKFAQQLDWRFVVRILTKISFFFVVLNVTFALLNPLPLLGRISAYNFIFPGRLRLPFGADPSRAYNLNIDQLEAMFASHEINGPVEKHGEFRILILGDSSVWGFLLEADQTLAEVINKSEWQTRDGRNIRALNIGYPTMSAMKDLLLLDYGLQFDPHMIIWFITLESLVYEKQLEPPLIRFNPEPSRSLIERYDLNLDLQDPRFQEFNFWDRTMVGSRRILADLARLQMLGALWASTGVDHVITIPKEPSAGTLDTEEIYHGFKQGQMGFGDLAFEVLNAGYEAAADIPLLLVNEPIFIFEKTASETRYNIYYPRWAYDRYRELLVDEARSMGWDLLDAWEVLEKVEFADHGIHYTPRGAETLAMVLKDEIIVRANYP